MTVKMKYLPLGAEFKHDQFGDITSKVISTDPLKFQIIGKKPKGQNGIFTPDKEEQNLPVFVSHKHIECPLCKGKKTWECIARVLDSKGWSNAPAVTMPCHVCNETGKIDPVKYAKDAEDNDNFWCSCEQDHGVTFFDDGESEMCTKHCYVCNGCGKVQQVG